MRFFVLCFSLLILVGPKSLHAQQYVDLFRLHANQAPAANYPGADNQADMYEAGIDLTLPIPLSQKIALITGLTAERQSFFADSSLFSRSEIYSSAIKIGSVMRLNPSLSLTLIALPKFSGDIHGDSKNDFQFGGMFLIKHSKTQKLNYSFGSYVNRDRFGLFVVPLIGMYYLSPRSDLEINATLPIWADIKKRVGFSTWCGISFSAMVRTYYMNNPELNNQNLYLERKSNDLLAYVQFDLSPSLLLQTKLGYSLGREAELYNDNDQVDLGLSLFRLGDNRNQLNVDMKDGPMVQIKVIYRYHLDRQE